MLTRKKQNKEAVPILNIYIRSKEGPHPYTTYTSDLRKGAAPKLNIYIRSKEGPYHISNKRRN